MVPTLFRIRPATPELPLPPTPTGHSTVLPAPTFSFHSEEKAERDLVKPAVVPEPSERWATVMLPGAQPRADQLVMAPMKMSTTWLWLTLRSQPGLL